MTHVVSAICYPEQRRDLSDAETRAGAAACSRERRMERVTGSCLCGAVRLEAQGQPYRVGVCHCFDCRKHHGALFHASAIFSAEAVTVQGETRDYEGRYFCPRCGSS